MYLSPTPPPEFRTCAKKVFAPGEVHITRLDWRSVLILMTKGTLTFREDGQDISVGEGEYYLQREGIMQEGLTPGVSPEYYFIEFNGTYRETNEHGVCLPLRGTYRESVILPILESFEALFAGHTANQFLLNSYMNRVFGELSSGLLMKSESDGVLDRPCDPPLPPEIRGDPAPLPPAPQNGAREMAHRQHRHVSRGSSRRRRIQGIPVVLEMLQGGLRGFAGEEQVNSLKMNFQTKQF